MLCDLKIQFEKHMNEAKFHLAEPLVSVIAALNKTEGLYRWVPGPAHWLQVWFELRLQLCVCVCVLTGKLWS